MSDTTLNRFVASGTAAERAAFVPSPPQQPMGPILLYVWYETDTGETYLGVPEGSPLMITWSSLNG